MEESIPANASNLQGAEKRCTVFVSPRIIPASKQRTPGMVMTTKHMERSMVSLLDSTSLI
ncbi:MAG: hypothetical protein LKI76_09875 [Megasphaera sp.]|nr:hypothetical protein [Megasphaera sp.]